MSTETIETIELSLIIIDPELQQRETMNQETITQYAEDMLAGVQFPPIRCYRIEGRTYVTDGFHRCHAAVAASLDAITCEVIEGSYADAMTSAATSNIEHDTNGLRRLNIDKRRSATMLLKAHSEWSDRRIAKEVGVGQTLVFNIRHALIDLKNQSTSRIDQNGIDRKLPFIPDDREPTNRMFVSNEATWTPEYKKAYDIANPPLPSSIAAEVKPVARPTFNQTNEMVDWAKWTWNPVTGCEHNCFYCYARDIANRFYAEKFTPTNRPERLDAPRNTRLPGLTNGLTSPVERTAWKNVFVCSMADLFGRWVPQEWIDGVFDSCRRSPEWNYLFLTKFPQRYVGLDFPSTAWVGTSVDEQKRVPNAEKAFRKIKVPVRWLSVEPMLEPIRFSDMSMFDWVVIGGQSRSSGGPESFPEPGWIVDLIAQARQSGCKVYCKPNLDPDAWWSKRFREYPSAFEQ